MKRALRIITIILLSLTIVFTVLGGAGTSCVAWNADTLEGSMAKMAPVMTQLKILVVLSIAAGLWGIYSTIRLSKGRANGWLFTILFLVIGAVTSGIQYYYSSTLRGSTAPNSMRLYITLLTLLVLLIIRLPGIWTGTGFDKPKSDKTTELAGGAALFVSGLITLTTPFWAANTHIINGYNTVYDLLVPLLVAGGAAVFYGWILLRRALRPVKHELEEAGAAPRVVIQG